MKSIFKAASAAALLSVFAVPASASYITTTWDDNGSVGNYEWSDANGYTFEILEFSDDLRIDVDLDGRKLRIDAMNGLLDDGAANAGITTGTYDIISFDGDDDNLIDHSEFQSEGETDFFEIVSLGTWDAGSDSFDAIQFNFQITENNDLLTGVGCIGGSCGSTAVPIPAAVWLFGSAIAGLGWMRRK